jgi:hypothetical protein
MNTLHLTPGEQQLFDALPGDLREGWQTQAETLTYADTPAKREVRLGLMRLHDPLLLKVRDATQHSSTAMEMVDVLKNINLKDVDEDDIASLFFALGPNDMSHLIAHLLQNAKTDLDLEGITALTVIRHSILEAFDSVSRA